jgi:uncharacterized protein (DUF1501 family)
VFLNGGNDGNNTFVDLSQYSSYASARGVDLTIPQGNFLAVSPTSGGSFGFHPNMPELQTLFNAGKLAVLCNNGPLVEPLTQTTYLNGTGKKPLQLFSHSDQVALFQTSIANTVSQTGWGGRVADKTLGLNGSAMFPNNVSIAGVNLFLTGVDVRQLAVADSNTLLRDVLMLNTAPGATTAEINSRLAAFDQLRTFDNNFKLIIAASDIRSSSLQTDAALSNVNPTLTTPFPTNTSIGRQLKQVALLIKACSDPLGINMKRQIFFTQIGGFDTHSSEIAGQGSLLTQVSAAIKAFFDATVELGVQDKVTTFTMSDFGRTLQSSGTGAQAGSDHGWGNHQFIVGGSVLGNTLYGTYPTLALGGPNDTNTPGSSARGRWIPTTSVDQYAATLATWYGLSSVDLPAVFPLPSYFSPSNLGFLTP